MRQPAEELVSVVAPASMEADQYRGLRHTLERMHRDAGLRMLAITSPGAGDGKTVTTLNLAGALAQSRSSRVLVIDADLHRPSIAEYLGLDQRGPGLADVLQRAECTLEGTTLRLDALNLSVLPSGVCESGVYELLNSSRLEMVMKEARRRFDFVLVDTPPLVPLPDCRVLGQWLDGFLVVVTAHRTPRKALAEALNLLDPAKLMGFVFNGDDRPLARYSSYYGSYGSHKRPLKPSGRRFFWHRRPRADDAGPRPAP